MAKASTTIDQCDLEVRKIIGRDLTGRERDTLRNRLNWRARKIKELEQGITADEALRRAGAELADEEARKAAVAARNKMLQYQRKVELRDYLKTYFADDPVTGLKSILVGTESRQFGSKFSVGREQTARIDSYQQGMLSDLEVAGVLSKIAKGQSDDDLARALYEIRTKTKDTQLDDIAGIDRDIMKAAAIIADWQERARLAANRAGADISFRDDWIITQSHAMDFLRDAQKRLGGERSTDEAVNRDAWIDFLFKEDLLDPETFEGIDGDTDPRSFLESVYNVLVTGIHMSSPYDSTGAPAHGLSSALAERMSARRILHFQDAEAFMKYQKKFGSGSLTEGILGNLSYLAQQTVMMERLGPNPHHQFADLMQFAKEKIVRKSDSQAKMALAMKRAEIPLRGYFSEISGELNMHGVTNMASWGRNIRAIQSMSKLGGAVISAISDVAFQASELTYQGENAISAMAKSMGSVVHGATMSAQSKRFLSDFGVGIDAMRGTLAARYSIHDTVHGQMSKAMQLFFKVNGLQKWTDSARAGMAHMVSSRMARYADTGWESLDGLYRDLLEQYGIRADMWDAMRAVGVEKGEGVSLFNPMRAKDISDETIAGMLTAQKVKPTQRRIDDLRYDMQRKFMAFISDRTRYGVLEPDAETRAISKGFLTEDHFWGQASRYFSQFKQFPLAVMLRPFRRNLAGALKGDMQLRGFATLVLASTALGYVAMEIKAALKGQSPRTLNTPAEVGNTIIAAMLQGGGAGLYGDFLFGLNSRYGQGALESFMGPTYGTISQAYDVYSAGREYVAAKATGEDTKKDPANELFRLLKSNMPGANLWFVKPALDYMLLYHIQEMVSPGSLKRMESTIKKETGREFFVPPSELVQ